MPDRSLPREYIRRIWRAIYEFNLIEPEDRVLVGLSGGKDSTFMLYALSILREHPPFPFELGAITVDMGFPGGGEDRPLLERYCQSLGLPFIWVETNIAAVALEAGEGKPKDPCARCSYFRRAVLAENAVKHGYGKLALAHHHDDAVETFLMSILYSGQIRTFTPSAHLDRSGITVIRPLVYLREGEVRRGSQLTGFEPLKSRCPRDRHTQRQRVKELLHELTRENRFVYTNVAAAMRAGRPLDLWPAELRPDEKRKANFGAWAYTRKANGIERKDGSGEECQLTVDRLPER